MTVMLAHARRYFEFGLNVLPITEKRTPVNIAPGMRLDWSPYKDMRQTEDDIRQLPWGEAKGVGLICGAVSAQMAVIELEGAEDESALEPFLTGFGLALSYPWGVVMGGMGYLLPIRVGGMIFPKGEKTARGGVNPPGKIKRAGTTCPQVQIYWTGHFVPMPPSLNGENQERLMFINGELPDALPAPIENARFWETVDSLTVKA